MMQLRAFAAVRETGTVTEAASQLGRTQPQISRLIADVELASGLALFRREKRRLVPTEEGAAFYEEVIRILHGFDDLARMAAVLGRERPEQLRVLTMPSLAHSLIPDCVGRLRQRYPRAVVKIDIATRNQLGGVVGVRPFDIAVAILPSMDLPGMTVAPLGRVPSRLLVPGSHALARRRQLTLRQIAAEPLVATSKNTVLRVLLDELCARERLALRVVAEAPNVLGAGRLAEAGVGIAIVDALTAHCFDPRLVATLPWKPELTFEVGLIEPRKSRPHPIAEAFANECRVAFGHHARRWGALASAADR